MLLRRGSTGTDVLSLVLRLRQLGLFYSGEPDYVYGGGVESAVKAFQTSKGRGAERSR